MASSCWKEKKRVITRYDVTAHIYNLRYRKEQCRKYEAVLNSLEVAGRDLILDVGCGTGLFIQRIVKLGGIIVGVDCSRKMLEETKKEAGHLINVSLICGDADYLPLRESIFDKVFAFTLLQNMPNPRQTFLEVMRVAKIDSYIVLTAQKKFFTKRSFAKLLEDVGLPIFKFFDDEELKDYIVLCRRQRE